MKVACRWFVCAALWCAVAIAAEPPPAASPPEVPAACMPGAAGATVPQDASPDDDFIEFLGADDVQDAAWWEFLKNAAPRKAPPSTAAPPQDASHD